MSVPGGTLPVMETFYGTSLADQLFQVPVKTDAEVLARVDAIIDPATRRERTLWLFFLNPDGTQPNLVMPIDEIPSLPGPDEADGLFEMLSHILDPEEPDGAAGSVVMTLTRPGGLELAEGDRRWLALFRRGVAKCGTPVRMLCLATPEGVRELGAVKP